MTFRSPRWLTIAVLRMATLLTWSLVEGVKNAKDPNALSSLSGPQTIHTTDGTTLSAESYVPGGNGPYPLVVMPASWGSAATEYASLANGFAALGYVVVAYAQRGFGASTGQIDLADGLAVGRQPGDRLGGRAPARRPVRGRRGRRVLRRRGRAAGCRARHPDKGRRRAERMDRSRPHPGPRRHAQPPAVLLAVRHRGAVPADARRAHVRVAAAQRGRVRGAAYAAQAVAVAVADHGRG